MDRITKAIELANKSRKSSKSGVSFLAGLDVSSIKYVDIPQKQLESNKVIAGILTNPVSEYYRLLRTKVLKLMDQNGWRVIGVTGPSVSSGKTLTATNLAVAISMEPNHTALLVDADLRKPAVDRLFGITPKVGLGEFIVGEVALEDVIIRPGMEKLGVILNTQQKYGSSDLLKTKAISEMVAQIKSSDENLVAIFDLPPVFVGDDAVAMSANLDAVLVIVDSGKTTKDQLSGTLELLKDVNVIGCVLNNAPDSECLAQQYGYY